MRVILLALLAVTSVSGFVPTPFLVQPSQRRPLSLSSTATEEITGTVKWYNEVRGYGFIEMDDGGPDMYVHATGLETGAPLKDGDRVQFVTEIDRRTNKPKAVGVSWTDKAAPAAATATAAVEIPPPKAVAPAPAPKMQEKKASVNPNQRALLEAKLQYDEAARANAKKAKSLQDEKNHRSLLVAKLKYDESAKVKAAEAEKARIAAEAEKARLAKEAEEARIAAEAEKARLAEEAEKARIAKEAEEKRLAEEAEKARIAAEAEKARLAEEAEKARLAKEAEEKRLAEEAEKARIAAEAEKARLAKEAEEKRLAEEAAAAEKAELEAAAAQKGWTVEQYKARTAYKDPVEEPKLAAKYAAISDIGEKAFAILVDLMAVDVHPDPDDPNVVIEDEDDDE